MKNIFLILVAVITSLTASTQVRFNYVHWAEDDAKDDSTGYIYYTSDPDTILVEAKGFKASVIYYFDNEGETSRYIPVYKTKVKKDEVIYFGKLGKKRYKMTYNKKYGDFVIKERALDHRYTITMFFHRDYDYYEQLSDTGK